MTLAIKIYITYCVYQYSVNYFLINTSQTAASLWLIATVQKKMILTTFTSVIIFMDKEFCEVFMPSFLLMCPDLSEVLVGERAFN